MESRTLTAEEARQKLDETKHQNEPFETKAREALELGEQYLGAENAHLARINRESNHWETTVSTDPHDGPFPEGLELDLQETYCRQTIDTDGPVTLHNAPDQGWDDDPAFEKHELHCYHGTTLYLDDEPYGTLCFVADDPREDAFDTEETMFVDLIRRLLEQELERRHYQDELTRRNNLVNVLNRVLRHNLRNDMSVIRGKTQQMASQLGDSTAASTIFDKVDNLIELSDKARDVEKVVEQNDDREQRNLRTVLEDVIADIADRFPDSSISLTADSDVTAGVCPSFDRAVRELIENAAKHGGQSPDVDISVEQSLESVRIQIADTGPGLSNQERKVLESGVETPLIHGSGLGLWLAHWIVTSHEGSVDASTTGSGTLMTVSVPRSSATDGTNELDDLKQARDQYQAAFEKSFDAHLLLDDKARVLQANPEATAIYGMEQATLRGQSVDTFFQDSFDFEDKLTMFQDEDRTSDIETIRSPDGQEKQIEYSLTVDVVPGQHLLTARDVTDRQQRKSDLEGYETALDSINDAVWVYDRNKQVSFTNESNLDGLSVASDDIVGMPLTAFENYFVDSATFDAWESIIDDILAGDTAGDELDVRFEIEGEQIVLNLRAAPVPDRNDPTGVAVIGSDITTRKKRERTLAEYKTIIEALGDPVYVIDADGRFTYVNDELVELVGYDRETIIGNTPSLFKNKPAIEQAEHQLGRLLSSDGPETVSFMVSIQPRDDCTVICEDKMGVLPYEGDKFNGSVGTLRSITDRREEYRQITYIEPFATQLTELANNLLRQDETDIDTKVNDSLETIGRLVSADRSYVFDVNQDIKTIDNTYEWTADGVEPQIEDLQDIPFSALPWWMEQLENDETISVQRVADLPPEAAAAQELLQAQDIESVVVLPVIFDGELRGFVGFDWVTTQSAWSEEFLHILAISGELIFSGLNQNRQRRELEAERQEKLELEQSRTTALFQQIGEPVAEVEFENGTPIIDAVNESFTETFGTAEAQLTGEDLVEVHTPALDRSTAASIAHRTESGGVVEEEVTVPTVDGDRVFLLRTVPYASGGSQRAYRIYYDITERKHREERFQAFIEQSTDIITVLDVEGTYQYVSPSMTRVVGHDPADLVGKSAFEYVHPDDRERLMETFSEVASNPDLTPTTEFRFRHADGSWVWIESIANNQMDNDLIEGVVVNSRDISARKEREQRVQRERDRLNKFAGTVSHDLRNPLNVAQGRLDMAQEKRESEHLDIIERAHDRMEQLITDVLALARAGESIGETNAVNLKPVIKGCWQNVETGAAELVVETDANVSADKTQLKQLLENLFRNAVEHGNEQVKITVGDASSGFYVADNGPGIPPSERSKILDPGYSTSEAGNGFGLSIVRDIAHAHDWTIDITESSGGGARFTFVDSQEG